MSKKGSTNPFARTVTNTAPQQSQQQQQYNAPRGQPQGHGEGRGGGGGGGASMNPFAAGAQKNASFNQPVQQHQQQQPRSSFQQPNNRPGGQNQFQQPQQQPAARNPFGSSQQQPQQNAPAGRSNPFASSSFSGGTMEMDSGMGIDTNRSGNLFNQQRAHNQPAPGGPRPFHSNAPHKPAASANPFAAASNAPANIFAAQNSSGPAYQQTGFQNPSPAASRNPFAQPAQPGFSSFNNTPPQQQHQSFQSQQQQFQQGNQFQAQSSFQARPSAGFASAAAAAPVRAEVNAHTLSAVNVSAALASNKVDEIDLGLGGGMPEPPGVSASMLSPPGALGSSSSAVAGAGAWNAAGAGGAVVPAQAAAGEAVSSADAAGEQLQALLRTLLASSALVSLPEEAPADDPYALMLSTGVIALTAGRVPAIPPAKVSNNSQPGHRPQQGRTAANPFAGGYQ